MKHDMFSIDEMREVLMNFKTLKTLTVSAAHRYVQLSAASPGVVSEYMLSFPFRPSLVADAHAFVTLGKTSDKMIDALGKQSNHMQERYDVYHGVLDCGYDTTYWIPKDCRIKDFAVSMQYALPSVMLPTIRFNLQKSDIFTNSDGSCISGNDFVADVIKKSDYRFIFGLDNAVNDSMSYFYASWFQEHGLKNIATKSDVAKKRRIACADFNNSYRQLKDESLKKPVNAYVKLFKSMFDNINATQLYKPLTTPLNCLVESFRRFLVKEISERYWQKVVDPESGKIVMDKKQAQNIFRNNKKLVYKYAVDFNLVEREIADLIANDFDIRNMYAHIIRDGAPNFVFLDNLDYWIGLYQMVLERLLGQNIDAIKMDSIISLDELNRIHAVNTLSDKFDDWFRKFGGAVKPKDREKFFQTRCVNSTSGETYLEAPDECFTHIMQHVDQMKKLRNMTEHHTVGADAAKLSVQIDIDLLENFLGQLYYTSVEHLNKCRFSNETQCK